MRWKWATLIVILFLFLGTGQILLVAKKNTPETKGAGKTDTIVIAREVDADSLDPFKTSNTQSLQVANLIYDNLLTQDEKGIIHPGLAEKWSISKDGLEYRFVIRSGIKFHDGTPLDAKAIKFNFDRAVDPATNNPSASMWGSIKSTTADGKTVIVKLSEPYGPLPSSLASFFCQIISPTSVKGNDFTPIGTGPYKFVEWVRNDHMTLVSNSSYKNFNPLVENSGEPYIKNVKIQVIPEAVARMAALKTGEITFAEPSLEEAATLAKDPNYTVYTSQYSGQQIFVAFSWKIPPLDNPDVRKAIGYALDRDAYAEIGFEGLVKPAYCPIAPGLIGSDQDLCKDWGINFNIDKAKQLLAKAGYGPNKPINVILSVHKLPGWDRMHQIMQENLKEIGVNARIETRELAAFFAHMADENKRTEGAPFIWTMGMSGNDPDYLYFLWHTPGFDNMAIGKELDFLLEEQRKLTGDARVKKINEINRYLLDNAYCIPLLSPGWNWMMASKSDVVGFKHGFITTFILNDVKFK
jgi:peptide/nickel transport system substrate-binding protein